MAYSDSTPAVSYGYDRLGRLVTNTCNGITTTFAYNLAGEHLSETFSGGTLDGLTLTNACDQFLRRTNLSAQHSSTPLLHHSYTYDSASRLQTVTDNTGATAYSAAYNYLANSPLVSQIVFQQGATTRMTTTKQWDNLNRLTSVSSALPGSSSLASFAYVYNSANQRIRSTLADGSYWLYEYDSLGQVRSGRKYWPDQTPVAGQQFEYAHDDIGNRTQTKAGGDSSGASLRLASYSANSLNQYTSRDVPGAVDIMGISFGTNTVTVNGQTAYRKGEYFRKELPVNNTSSALWTNITVAATGQSSVSGNEFVPKTPEQFYYDADGNLTNDGRWTYTWDAENRLVKMVPNTAVGPQVFLQFEYDWQGRRIHKQVWPNTTGSGTPTNDVTFVYDGWNLLAELNATNNAVIRSCVWGLDLSGSLQGAGGVGGLLFICDLPSAIGHCAPAYDGNGNIMALVSMSGGTNVAQYEYGPFGEVLRATGSIGKVNPFRFSTKYQDDETDLLYYGYRSYNASTGRWLSRDPAEEVGGINLYVCIENDLANSVDSLGLMVVRPGTQPNERIVYPGAKIKIPEGVVIILRPPSAAERAMGNKAVCLVRKLIPYAHYPPWRDVWIADMPVEGYNYRAAPFSRDRNEYIFINYSLLPSQGEWQITAMLGYGNTLAHEADHYFNISDDPETKRRINDAAQEAARRAQASEIDCKYCIYTASLWKIRNLLEKYACECGINLGSKPGRDPLK